jgi:hypothetical protein
MDGSCDFAGWFIPPRHGCATCFKTCGATVGASDPRRSTSNQRTTIAGFHKLGEYRTATPEHNPTQSGDVDDEDEMPSAVTATG